MPTPQLKIDKNPLKLYYSISEVGEILGEKLHTIRYWETEFPEFLVPLRHPKSNVRRYTPNEIRRLMTVQFLLRNARFTIEGARQKLNGQPMRSLETSQEAWEILLEGNGLNMSPQETVTEIVERLRESGKAT